MTTPRHWLCVTTSTTEVENIDEMTRDIWRYFDGIAAVVHTQGGDDSVQRLLAERKGDGFVIERPYPWHHAHSKNEWLFDRRIRAMDCCWIRDSLERINPAFAADIKPFAADLLDQNVWNLAQWSKMLMFRRWYNQQFLWGLHWGLIGAHGHTVAIEQFPAYRDERQSAYSVRNTKRPPEQRYMHELCYTLDYGLNGNHLALFHPDPADLDRAQWRFYEYTQWMQARGITTAQQLIDWWKENKLDSQHKTWLNAERPLRNAYRWFILKHTDEEIKRDEDTWRLT